MAAAKIVISRSIEETGIRKNLLEDLALKIIYRVGEISLNELARHMGLSYKIVEDLFQRLRRDQLCQVTGMAGGTHRVTASSGGKSRALELLAQNQYCRSRARVARGLRRAHRGPERARHPGHARGCHPCLRRPGARQRDPEPARRRGDVRPGHFSLRAHRHGQDDHRRDAHPSLRPRPRLGPLRGGGGRPDHHGV